MPNLRTLLGGVLVTLFLICSAVGHGEDPALEEAYRAMSRDELVREVARLVRPPAARQERERARGCQGCFYAFQDPIMPSFDLPPAQPNSPGDVTLNVGNPIVHADGSPLLAGCNGNKAQWLDDGVWTSHFTNAQGQRRKLDNAFYVSGSALNVRTIQQNEANLESVLSGKQVRMDITCDNGVESCLHFFVHATPKVASCDDACEGLINRTAEDERLNNLRTAHFVAEVVLSDIPLTLATFVPDGSVIFYGAGNGGAPALDETHLDSIGDFYGNYVMHGKLNNHTDFLLNVLKVHISEDHLIIEVLLSFTHTKDMPSILPGVAPTNRPVRFPFLVFFQFEKESGLIIQERVFWDQGTVLKQLGLITDPSLPIVDADFFDKYATDDPLAGPPFNQFLRN